MMDMLPLTGGESALVNNILSVLLLGLLGIVEWGPWQRH